MGSIEAERRAGSSEVTKAIIGTKTAATASTSGSNELTPNRNDCSNCEAAVAPSNPTAQPASARLKLRSSNARVGYGCFGTLKSDFSASSLSLAASFVMTAWDFSALRRNLNNSSINGGFRGGDFSVGSGG